MMSVDNRIAAGPDDLPIAIIGAGPIGLAMAAHLVGCDKRFIIFEAGPEAGHAIRQWQHVRLFTEWASNIDTEAERLLLGAGWRPPAGAAIPTGGELLDDILQPSRLCPQSSRISDSAIALRPSPAMAWTRSRPRSAASGRFFCKSRR